MGDVTQKKGREESWPPRTCGLLGRCRPCGALHNLTDRSFEQSKPKSKVRCLRNHLKGCPDPKPEPNHDYSRVGKCRVCGTWRS